MSEFPSSICPQCGAEMPGATEGLCPRCLMAQVMRPTQDGGEDSAPIPPIPPEELAPHFPQLEILECLGRGGMGVVYKARQKSLNRFVALKLLAPERADDPQFAVRFEKEAHALAALNHPHIVGVYDFGQAGGFYFLLMEFVDGLNLRQLLQTKRLTPKEALSIVPPVCDALQCAHDHGIVHRDIKPENLLMDKAGVVKIADFGIAKMYRSHLAPRDEPCVDADATTERTKDAPRSGESPQLISRSEMATMGTPDYAAPEQHDGTATDHRADIYSLGVVLYEMLTGERPQQDIVAPSKRVQVDVRIDEIVMRALEKAPELRFATAAEFRTQVEAAVSTTSSASTDASGEAGGLSAGDARDRRDPVRGHDCRTGAAWSLSAGHAGVLVRHDTHRLRDLEMERCLKPFHSRLDSRSRLGGVRPCPALHRTGAVRTCGFDSESQDPLDLARAASAPGGGGRGRALAGIKAGSQCGAAFQVPANPCLHCRPDSERTGRDDHRRSTCSLFCPETRVRCFGAALGVPEAGAHRRHEALRDRHPRLEEVALRPVLPGRFRFDLVWNDQRANALLSG